MKRMFFLVVSSGARSTVAMALPETESVVTTSASSSSSAGVESKSDAKVAVLMPNDSYMPSLKNDKPANSIKATRRSAKKLKYVRFIKWSGFSGRKGLCTKKLKEAASNLRFQMLLEILTQPLYIT